MVVMHVALHRRDSSASSRFPLHKETTSLKKKLTISGWLFLLIMFFPERYFLLCLGS